MSDELKACPFCGKNPVMHGKSGKLCGCNTPECAGGYCWISIAAWNTRADDGFREANLRLRDALEQLRDCDWVITPANRMDAVRDIARAALEPPK